MAGGTIELGFLFKDVTTYDLDDIIKKITNEIENKYSKVIYINKELKSDNHMLVIFCMEYGALINNNNIQLTDIEYIDELKKIENNLIEFVKDIINKYSVDYIFIDTNSPYTDKYLLEDIISKDIYTVVCYYTDKLNIRYSNLLLDGFTKRGEVKDMEDKKTIKIKFSTGVCFFIIILLLLVICGMYFYYNNKGKVIENTASQENVILQENIAKNEETINNESNTNTTKTPTSVEEPKNKNEFQITYTEESYKAYKENGEYTVESKRNLPVITNPANQNAADKIVKSLTDFSDKKWKEIKEASEEYKDLQYKAGVQYLFNTYLVKDNYIVLQANQSGDFGGVGWTAEEFYNYDAKTGNFLTLKNISTDYNKFNEIISNKVHEYINKNMNVIVPDLEESVNDILNQDGNWGFTESGISIVLPKYSIGSGADGVHIVKIDKSDINQYLLEEYKIK